MSVSNSEEAGVGNEDKNENENEDGNENRNGELLKGQDSTTFHSNTIHNDYKTPPNMLESVCWHVVA